MFSGRTWAARRAWRAPVTRAETRGVFQRAWRMAMRRGAPGEVSVWRRGWGGVGMRGGGKAVGGVAGGGWGGREEGGSWG